MISKERIEFIANELTKNHSTNFFKSINDLNAGIGFVLKLLYTSNNHRLSAGEICKAMGVSTARVAVILKKMEKQDLICREESILDARVTIIRLSKNGIQRAKIMKENMITHIGKVAEKIGEEKLLQFIALSQEIKNVMNEEFLEKSNLLK